jgi:hypothetical protein
MAPAHACVLSFTTFTIIFSTGNLNNTTSMSEDSFKWGNESSGNGESFRWGDGSDFSVDYFGDGRNLTDSRQ